MLKGLQKCRQKRNNRVILWKRWLKIRMRKEKAKIKFYQPDNKVKIKLLTQ